MDVKNLLSAEILKLTSLQREIYFPSNEREEIESRFFYHPRKVSWTSNIQLPMTLVREGAFCVYTADPAFHLLIQSVMIWKVPSVRVKKEYENSVQIAWAEDLGFALVREAAMYIGDTKVQSADAEWMCVYYQTLDRRAQKHEALEHMIGNRAELQTWTSELREATLIVPQPWYYNESEVFAVPLFFCAEQRVRHKYMFRARWSEVLRMRRRAEAGGAGDSGEWRELSEPALNCLEYSEDVLSPPDLIARYVQLTPEELEYRRRERFYFYIRDVVRWSDDVPKTYGDSVSVEIHTEQPCQAVFFVAQNVEWQKRRCPMRFTTLDGANPFQSAKLVYGVSEKVPERSIEYFDTLEPYFCFPKFPRKCCNGMCFCYDLTSVDPDVGIVFKNHSAKLILRLRERESRSELFRIKVYFLVLKRLVLENGVCLLSEELLK